MIRARRLLPPLIATVGLILAVQVAAVAARAALRAVIGPDPGEHPIDKVTLI